MSGKASACSDGSGHAGAEFSDEVASTIMRVSETHQAQLRHALSEGLHPPALFSDTLHRFRLEHELDRFTQLLEAGDPHAGPALQLQLLAEAPGWPNGQALTVLDEQGKVLAQYHSQSGNALPRPLQVRLGDDDVLEALMRQMTKVELEGLLQHPLGSGEPNFTTAKRQLQQQLATQAKPTKPDCSMNATRHCKNRRRPGAAGPENLQRPAHGGGRGTAAPRQPGRT
nr:hypothetical protein [Pseudomonas sp. BIGb0427]